MAIFDIYEDILTSVPIVTHDDDDTLNVKKCMLSFKLPD